ncbi:MAG: hypothetical protein J6Y02_16505 [Pseudobutyrivibrio sp.]|nr:hypothetical protein [Pseudobutyrivibrio sp.]
MSNIRFYLDSTGLSNLASNLCLTGYDTLGTNNTSISFTHPYLAYDPNNKANANRVDVWISDPDLRPSDIIQSGNTLTLSFPSAGRTESVLVKIVIWKYRKSTDPAWIETSVV